MASELKYWIGGTLALCLIIAVGAFPTSSGAAPSPDAPASSATMWAGEAGDLGVQWRAAWNRWRLESFRARLSPAADSARAAGGTAPLLLVDGQSPPEAREILNRNLAQLWHDAAPEGFKVAVALVIVPVGAGKAGGDTPTINPEQAPTYLFPDSLHRDMCLAVVHEGGSYGRRILDPRILHSLSTIALTRWLSEDLGPCAFYGAYGIPSPEIGRWLRGGGLSTAIYPRWWNRVPDRWLGYYYYGNSPKDPQPAQWFEFMYSLLPWDGVACYGGRVGQCARNVFDSSRVADRQPGLWDESAWQESMPFFSGSTYLSDLARKLGPARFSDFWTADVPMDSAIHLATGKTVGDWTYQWAEVSGPALHLGPSAPPLHVLWGMVPALLALAAALWYARRRQIG